MPVFLAIESGNRLFLFDALLLMIQNFASVALYFAARLVAQPCRLRV